MSYRIMGSASSSKVMSNKTNQKYSMVEAKRFASAALRKQKPGLHRVVFNVGAGLDGLQQQTHVIEYFVREVPKKNNFRTIDNCDRRIISCSKSSKNKKAKLTTPKRFKIVEKTW